MPGAPGPRLQDAADTPPSRAVWRLPAEPASVAEIRAGVRAFASAHGAQPTVVADMALAVSEVVTNAVLHAFVEREPGTIEAHATAGVDELVVIVADDGRGMQPRADSPGLGLGLPLIGQLATTVDLRRSAGGGAELCLTFTAAGVRGSAPDAVHGASGPAKLLEDVARTAAGAWPGEGVEGLVDLLVPAVADACAVDVIDGDGRHQRFAGRVDGPDAAASSAWLASLRPRADAAGSATRATVAEGVTHVSELTPDLIAAVTTNDDDAARMAATGIRWWVVVPLRDDAGGLLGLLHFGTRAERGRPSADLTRLLEAIAAQATGSLAATRLAAELRRSRRRFERILDVMAEAVTVRDREGRVVYANDAAARLLGAPTRDALRGSGPGELLHDFEMTREDGTPVAAEDLPASRLLAGLDAPPLLIRMVARESGTARWLLVKATLLDDDAEQLAVAVLEDVTESRRALERSARRARRAPRPAP